jgi:small neutral amino acid transporter SnatA (MarC family)
MVSILARRRCAAILGLSYASLYACGAASSSSGISEHPMLDELVRFSVVLPAALAAQFVMDGIRGAMAA